MIACSLADSGERKHIIDRHMVSSKSLESEVSRPPPKGARLESSLTIGGIAPNIIRLDYLRSTYDQYLTTTAPLRLRSTVCASTVLLRDKRARYQWDRMLMKREELG
jgi:hypothetical protein